MPYLSPKVLEALEYAAVAHDGQCRKFPKTSPYFSHPAAVGLVLAKAGYSDDVVIGGILHDVLEDTKITAEQIKEVFGERVLQLVKGVTEQPGLPWQERKDSYNVHLGLMDDEIKAISAADLLANRTSILLGLRLGLNPWENFSPDPKGYTKKLFINDSHRLAVLKLSASIPFLSELERTCEEVERLTSRMLNLQ